MVVDSNQSRQTHVHDQNSLGALSGCEMDGGRFKEHGGKHFIFSALLLFVLKLTMQMQMKNMFASIRKIERLWDSWVSIALSTQISFLEVLP